MEEKTQEGGGAKVPFYNGEFYNYSFFFLFFLSLHHFFFFLAFPKSLIDVLFLYDTFILLHRKFWLSNLAIIRKEASPTKVQQEYPSVLFTVLAFQKL